MEVDAALPGRRFVTFEYVRRLNRQMHRGRPQLSEATQVEEGGVALTIPVLQGDVVDQTAHVTCEFAATSLQRADDVW
jgi:hypothetical protein